MQLGAATQTWSTVAIQPIITTCSSQEEAVAEAVGRRRLSLEGTAGKLTEGEDTSLHLH